MKKYSLIILSIISLSLSSCKFYKLNPGGNFPPEIENIQIDFIDNKASVVAPALSPTLTDKIRDKFLSQSKLTLSENTSQLKLTGYVSGYDVQPVASKDNSTATLNRLRITVHIKSESNVAEKFNFEDDFQKFLEFDASKSLSEVEGDLIDEITDMLVQEIFNKIAMDW